VAVRPVDRLASIRLRTALGAALLCGLAPGAARAAGPLLIPGASTTDLQHYGIGWRFGDWQSWDRGNWRYTVAGELTYGYWRGVEDGAVDDELHDVGHTTILRMARLSGGTPRPYFEVGLGMHVLSGVKINLDRDLGIAFQFGEMIGVGMLFGEREQYSLAFRMQHESNANLEKPNNGLGLGMIVFTVHL
jgi:hypothetical protein